MEQLPKGAKKTYFYVFKVMPAFPSAFLHLCVRRNGFSSAPHRHRIESHADSRLIGLEGNGLVEEIRWKQHQAALLGAYRSHFGIEL